MRDSRSRRAHGLDGVLYAAAALFACAAALFVFAAFFGVGPFAVNLLWASLAGLGGGALALVALSARALGARPARSATYACGLAFAGMAVGLALIPAVALVKDTVADRKAAGVIDAVEARAAFCARREAKRIPEEPSYPLDPRPRYRGAVEQCVTEDGQFREFPDGPRVTCYSAACTVDLGYLDTYPKLDDRIVHLEPIMNEALIAAGAGPYRQRAR